MSAPASEQQQSTASASELLAVPAQDQTAGQTRSASPTRRLVALDAWRGLTIVLMLLVNNVALGEFTPAELVHAPWGGGLSLTDLVFPWFLFCAGAALPFSLGKVVGGKVVGGSGSVGSVSVGSAPPSWWPNWSTVRKLVARAAALYLVGALLTSVANQAPSLGLGVLQLIALASLGAGLLARWPLAWRWRLGAALGLLAAYQVFLLSAPFTETDNAVTRLNTLLLSDLGLRGLSSVLPVTALALLGSVAAEFLKVEFSKAHSAKAQASETQSPKTQSPEVQSPNIRLLEAPPEDAQRADRVAPISEQSTTDRAAAHRVTVDRALPLLLGLGAALSLGGWLLSGVMGYNKTVWTPAYVLYSAGLGTLGLLAFYLIADARGGRRSALLGPLAIAGRNSLFAYTAPILLKSWVLTVWKVNWTGEPLSILDSLLSLSRRGLGVQVGGWLYSLGYVAAVWLVLWLLARRGWTWKL